MKALTKIRPKYAVRGALLCGSVLAMLGAGSAVSHFHASVHADVNPNAVKNGGLAPSQRTVQNTRPTSSQPLAGEPAGPQGQQPSTQPSQHPEMRLGATQQTPQGNDYIYQMSSKIRTGFNQESGYDRFMRDFTQTSPRLSAPGAVADDWVNYLGQLDSDATNYGNHQNQSLSKLAGGLSQAEDGFGLKSLFSPDEHFTAPQLKADLGKYGYPQFEPMIDSLQAVQNGATPHVAAFRDTVPAPKPAVKPSPKSNAASASSTSAKSSAAQSAAKSIASGVNHAPAPVSPLHPVVPHSSSAPVVPAKTPSSSKAPASAAAKPASSAASKTSSSSAGRRQAPSTANSKAASKSASAVSSKASSVVSSKANSSASSRAVSSASSRAPSSEASSASVTSASSSAVKPASSSASKSAVKPASASSAKVSPFVASEKAKVQQDIANVFYALTHLGSVSAPAVNADPQTAAEVKKLETKPTITPAEKVTNQPTNKQTVNKTTKPRAKQANRKANQKTNQRVCKHVRKFGRRHVARRGRRHLTRTEKRARYVRTLANRIRRNRRKLERRLSKRTRKQTVRRHGRKQVRRRGARRTVRRYGVQAQRNFKGVRRAYVQPSKFRGKTAYVKITKNCHLYWTPKLRGENFELFRGQRVRIRRVVKRGHCLRLEVGKGRYLTANRRFVKVMSLKDVLGI